MILLLFFERDSKPFGHPIQRATVDAQDFGGARPISIGGVKHVPQVSALERVVANVPFSFVVRGEQFPAGRYEIRPTGGGVVVSIRGTDNKSTVVAIT